jgi:hypothetical protein
MTTYSITSAPGHGFHVVETFETLSWKRDGSPCYAQRVVAGPFTTRAQAQSEADTLDALSAIPSLSVPWSA